jgi:hypothetical protein
MNLDHCKDTLNLALTIKKKNVLQIYYRIGQIVLQI